MTSPNKHSNFLKIFRNINSRYLIPVDGDNSKIKDSEQIVKLNKLNSDNLEIDYKVFITEINRLKIASKKYFKWLLSINPITKDIDMEYLKMVLSIIFYTDQDIYSKIQNMFRNKPAPLGMNSERLRNHFKGTIPPEDFVLRGTDSRNLKNIINEIIREDNVEGLTKIQIKAKYEALFSDRKNLTISSIEMPFYFNNFFETTIDYYFIMSEGKTNEEFADLLLCPQKDLILFRGDVNPVLKYSKSTNHKNTIEKTDLTSLTYNIDKVGDFSKMDYSQEQYIQLIHLRNFIDCPYSICIESVSIFPSECEILMPFDTLINVINNKEDSPSKRVRQITVKNNLNNDNSVSEVSYELEKGIQLIQLSDAHRTGDTKANIFFNSQPELQEVLFEKYTEPTVAIIGVRGIKKKSSSAKKEKKEKKVNKAKKGTSVKKAKKGTSVKKAKKGTSVKKAKKGTSVKKAKKGTSVKKAK